MRHISPILLSLFFFISCTEEVDFNQINDLQISPVVEASLIFINAEANDFLVNGAEAPIPSDFIEVDLFSGSFINDNIIKVDLVFETENTLPRNFRFNIEFFDENRGSLDTFTFLTTEQSPHVKTFEGADLDIIKSTSFMSFSIEMLAGAPITSDTEGNISLKSKGVLHFNIER